MKEKKEIIERAREYALEAHGKQVYASNFPYLSHLEGVVGVLESFGHHDETMIASAYLHDTIEDTNTSYTDIKDRFGEEIAEIVYAVTDELGRNRKERHEKTYIKTRENEKAIILKLADRIANIKFSVNNKGEKFNMYKKEHEYFKNILYNGKNIEMWEKLEEMLKLY